MKTTGVEVRGGWKRISLGLIIRVGKIMPSLEDKCIDIDFA